MSAGQLIYVLIETTTAGSNVGAQNQGFPGVSTDGPIDQAWQVQHGTLWAFIRMSKRVSGADLIMGWYRYDLDLS
jgi:hypothetical protein